MDEKAQLLIGPDEKVPTGEAVLLGLQHVLAMDVYVPPIILGGLLAMGAADSTSNVFSMWDWYNLTNGLLYENACFSRAIICSLNCGSWSCSC